MVVVLLLLVAARARPGLEERSLQAGPSTTYEASLETLVPVAAQALSDAGVTLHEQREPEPRTVVLFGRTQTVIHTGNIQRTLRERVRVVLEQQGTSTVVRVVDSRPQGLWGTTGGGYTDQVFSAMDRAVR